MWKPWLLLRTYIFHSGVLWCVLCCVIDWFYVLKEPRKFWHLRLFTTSHHPAIHLLMAQGRICTQRTSWHRRINGPLYGSHLLFYVSERNSIAEPQHFTTTVTQCSPTVPFVEFSSSPQLKNDVPEEKDQKKLENEMSGKVELVLSQKVKHTWDKSS